MGVASTSAFFSSSKSSRSELCFVSSAPEELGDVREKESDVAKSAFRLTGLVTETSFSASSFKTVVQFSTADTKTLFGAESQNSPVIYCVYSSHAARDFCKISIGAETHKRPPIAMTGANKGFAAATPIVVSVLVLNAPTLFVEHQTAVCNVLHRPVLHHTAIHSELLKKTWYGGRRSIFSKQKFARARTISTGSDVGNVCNCFAVCFAAFSASAVSSSTPTPASLLPLPLPTASDEDVLCIEVFFSMSALMSFPSLDDIPPDSSSGTKGGIS
mmetsp:Transcript_53103/g.128923  ORF Transcript_53103/g.128923 Transcript_53103/m.128923 type:complete len:273 (-) Transcript_53103:1246-2064(-)